MRDSAIDGASKQFSALCKQGKSSRMRLSAFTGLLLWSTLQCYTIMAVSEGFREDGDATLSPDSLQRLTTESAVQMEAF